MGDWQVITGEVRAEMSISGKLTYSILNTGTYLNRDGLASFILPSSIMSDKPITNTQRQEDDLKQLEKIEDGNVADLSFSINALMSPEKLMKMLGNYDVVVTGMPVYAGELKDFDIAHSVGGGIDYYVPYLTLRPMSQFSENNRLSMWQLYFMSEDKDHMSQHVDYMMSDLEWMNNNIKYSFLDIDKQRLAYLRTHGVQVYGAILTGPVRELQKLKQHPEFHYFRLSRIEVWNWDKKQ